jgi:hypothetical protein
MPKQKHPPKIANFNTSPVESRVIAALTQTAVETSQRLGIAYDARTVERDLTVCHLNITALDLEGMATIAGTDEVVLDVIGIHLNIDRHQLTLKNGFTPKWRNHA